MELQKLYYNAKMKQYLTIYISGVKSLSDEVHDKIFYPCKSVSETCRESLNFQEKTSHYYHAYIAKMKLYFIGKQTFPGSYPVETDTNILICKYSKYQNNVKKFESIKKRCLSSAMQRNPLKFR